MYLHNLKSDFKLFMKNLMNVDCDIVIEGNTIYITIDNYIVYTFIAHNIEEFKFELYRYKLCLITTHARIYA